MHELFHASRRRFLAVASEFDLSPPQVRALGVLDPDRPVPMSELAEALHCDNSNVTGIVDRLEDRGLVERRSATHDRRVKMLAVTDARRRGPRARSPSGSSRRPSPLARLSPEDQRALRDIMRRALGRPDGDTTRFSPHAPPVVGLSVHRGANGAPAPPTYTAVGRISAPSRFCSRMCADHPATRAQVNMRREELGRHLGQVEQHRRPELDVRGEHAVGLARRAARRARRARAPRRPRSAPSRARGRCGAGRGPAGPRRGRRDGRSPSAARRGRARARPRSASPDALGPRRASRARARARRRAAARSARRPRRQRRGDVRAGRCDDARRERRGVHAVLGGARPSRRRSP